MGRKRRPTYEESIEIINSEINKRKPLWNLSSLSWIDFDDVAQIIRIHIYKKWKKYNYHKPLIPWLNKIITHQIRNTIRNVYGNYKRPCLGCDAYEGENLCRIYEIQCAKCPIYAAWEKNKKHAYEIKLPTSLENLENTTHHAYMDDKDIDAQAQVIHTAMKVHLKSTEWEIYKLLFIDNKTEIEAAKILGLSSNEKNRTPRSRWISHVRKGIIDKIKRLIQEDKIDL